MAEQIRSYPAFIPEHKTTNTSSVEQIMTSSRYVQCKGLGRFGKHYDPEGRVCKKSWKSVRAWCIIDLKKQCFTHRWSQKCKLCKGESKPWFDEQALKKMAEYAIKSCHSLPVCHTGSKQTAKKNEESCIGHYPQIEGPPRYEMRCVKCRKLGRSCWKNAKHVFDDQESLITAAGHGSLDNLNNTECVSEFKDEYYEEEYYPDMFEDTDDDSPDYMIYSDYEYTCDSDQYSPYDPYNDDYGDGDLYNSDGEPYDLHYPTWPW